jgi:predicted ATP-dependent endonuclease of OLD family
MKLAKLSISNFRSIRSAPDIRIESLQAFVGQNNAGKSNILRALRCFLSAGSGGMEVDHFNDPVKPASIECEFDSLSETEARRLRRYLIGGKVILRKELEVERDEKKGKSSVSAEYHGYMAEPKNALYSMKKIDESPPRTKDWKAVAETAGIAKYLPASAEKITKAVFQAALEKFLSENDVEYEEPVLGETQALGLPQNLLNALPELYLLPAVTDYSDEIDRRSSTTVFRRLMGDLADRIMQKDPRYREIVASLERVRKLMNAEAETGEDRRLDALGEVETSLRDVLQRLMPSVQRVQLGVEIEQCKDIFSKGVSVKIDDGVLTDVLDKGHGTQRSIVFSFLQLLIQARREASDASGPRPIILAIEEPELYIHPHCQRLVYSVLKEFAGAVEDTPTRSSDQVLYTTHSPAFVEVANYHRIAIVRKLSAGAGTTVQQCASGVLATGSDRKDFKLLTSFGLEHNEVFFSSDAIIVEGADDKVAVIATARKLGRIKELPDELGLSIVEAAKGEVPKFQKVLNAFGLSYGVLVELDGKPESDPQNAQILAHLNGNRAAKLSMRLEECVELKEHFKDQWHSKKFFSDPVNITQALEAAVTAILPPVTAKPTAERMPECVPVGLATN